MTDIYSDLLVGLNKINHDGMQILNAFDRGDIGDERAYYRLLELAADMKHLAARVKIHQESKELGIREFGYESKNN